MKIVRTKINQIENIKFINFHELRYSINYPYGCITIFKELHLLLVKS